MRVDDWMAYARRVGVERLDAQVLLAWHLGRPRSWLLAHGDDVLESDIEATSLATLARRAAGEPLAYLIGRKEFRGLELRVDSAVLVPRPETEMLVEWSLEVAAASGLATPRIADLGTGSGAIAIAIAHALPAACVIGSDVSAGALAIARDNAATHGVIVEWLQGAWWAPFAGRRVDVAVSNPPYVAAGDPHLAALRHEPLQALVAGERGLDAIDAIVAGAAAHLVVGGWLLLEHGHDQASAVRERLVTAGFGAIETRFDLARHERCTSGRLRTA